MPTPRLTDDELRARVQLWEDHGRNASAAARSLGKNNDKFILNAVREAAARGLLGYGPVLPGYRVASVTNTPRGDYVKQKQGELGEMKDHDGLSLSGVTYFADGNDGVMHKHVMFRQGAPDPVAIAERIAEKFKGISLDLPEIPQPDEVLEDCVSLYPIADWHLGMLAWGQEVAENWDLKIAEGVLKEAQGAIFARTQPSKVGIVLGLGDFTHIDNKESQTAKSRNALDSDGRYEKIAWKACEMALWMVKLALQKHQVVHVKFIPGNHDEYTAVTVNAFLAGVFWGNDRVVIDNVKGDWWSFEFGRVFLVATHGHKIKPKDVPGFVSARWRKEWGRARFVHGFMGHFHHGSKPLNDDGGMTLQMMPAPIPPDAYHYGAGYFSGRSVQSLTFHKSKGLQDNATRMIFNEHQ